MIESQNGEDIRRTIVKMLNFIDDKFKRKTEQKIDNDKLSIAIEDLDSLFNSYYEIDKKSCCKIIIQRYIKLIEFLIKYSNDTVYAIEYLKSLENAYRMAGSVSFEHFLIYYEWYEDDKIYEKRYEILKSYVHFLNLMCYYKVDLIIANLPSGYGKTRVAKLYEAFRFGIEPTGTFLSLCSNDNVVKGGSRSVIDIMKSERYSNIFPIFKYDKKDNNYFIKETDGEWKIKQCKLSASYYASTTMSNVVGSRASLSIHIDDLYADYKEALDEEQNKYYYNKFITVWRKRFVQTKEPQIIISGTMWSPTDFITKVIDLALIEDEFVECPDYKYTRVSVDGRKVIIQVPAIDEETGESSCPSLRSTEALLKEKLSMESYLWETNFQQNPVAPEGLYFDYTSLKTYDAVPKQAIIGAIAVIDGTRKSGKDYFSMPILINYGDDYALIDCIFTKKATNELTKEIVDKIIEWHITSLVIETNVDGGLKSLLDNELQKIGVSFCETYENYNYIPKPTRINNEKYSMIKRIVYPKRGLYGINTDMGKFMENFTRYNLNGRNKNDDAPDSLAMATYFLIAENIKPQKAHAIKRLF
ncbi:MAG: hypothetical protein RR478_00895 [Bacilli bacterium]